ncbi:hypothetical protein [Clostridium gallinarum]|uniref:hypothetical protein n=1 Tax=Clostridium gallinarum TaxID=2762246 RepID=UPI001FADEA1C|nr:hypothetical protein [Clostridium gallinarum]
MICFKSSALLLFKIKESFSKYSLINFSSKMLLLSLYSSSVFKIDKLDFSLSKVSSFVFIDGWFNPLAIAITRLSISLSIDLISLSIFLRLEVLFLSDLL